MLAEVKSLASNVDRGVVVSREESSALNVLATAQGSIFLEFDNSGFGIHYPAGSLRNGFHESAALAAGLGGVVFANHSNAKVFRELVPDSDGWGRHATFHLC